MSSRKTHKLRGVKLLPDKGRKGITVALDRYTITRGVLNSDMLALPSNFNDMHEHEKLRALKLCHVRHVPQYS